MVYCILYFVYIYFILYIVYTIYNIHSVHYILYIRYYILYICTNIYAYIWVLQWISIHLTGRVYLKRFISDRLICKFFHG